MAQSLAEWLRLLRVERALSLVQLAARAGVSPRALSYWEAGTHQPRLPELETVLTTLSATSEQRAEALELLAAPRATRRLRLSPEYLRQEEAFGVLPSGGDLLRVMRQRRGLQREQIAAQMGISGATLSRWESSKVVPPSDRLDALLTILGARDWERSALKDGYLFLMTPLRGCALPPAELRERFNAFMVSHIAAPDHRLDHLHFFAFEVQAWRLAAQSAAGQHLLAEICAHQAAFYAAERQAKEAGHYAYRALGLLANDSAEEESRLRATIIAAVSEVYRGRRPAPERGLNLLQPWRDRMTLPRFRAWLLADMAEYLALQSDWDASLRLHEEACRVAERAPDPEDLRFRKMDMAKVALSAGQIERALSLVTLSDEDFPSRRAGIELFYVEALLLLGERKDAQTWLARANADIQAHDLTHLCAQADMLMQRF